MAYSLTPDVDLFGWKQAVTSGARRLIITEGEFDAIALTKILQTYTPEKWLDNAPAVVSIPNGSATASKDIARLLPKIRKQFKDVDSIKDILFGSVHIKLCSKILGYF